MVMVGFPLMFLPYRPNFILFVLILLCLYFSNISPIIHVWSASQRDAIFLLYDNGVISMRCRKRLYTVANTPALAESDNVNQDPVLVRRYQIETLHLILRLSLSLSLSLSHSHTSKQFFLLV